MIKKLHILLTLIPLLTLAQTETINGVEWTYEVVDDAVVLGGVNRGVVRKGLLRRSITAVPTNTSGSLVVPNVIAGKPVRDIGQSAFFACRALTSVTIPANVARIGACAFSACGSLKSATIPTNVVSIGEAAFSDCKELKSVRISSGVTCIGDCAFWGCSGLESVTISSTVTNIGCHAFANCPILKSIDVVKNGKPEAVSFDDFCKRWKLERSPEKMPVGPREGSLRRPTSKPPEVRTVTTNGVEWTYVVVRGSATLGVNLLRRGGPTEKRLAIPQGTAGALDIPCVLDGKPVRYIGNGAFSGCKELTSVTIPSSVTSIGSSAFIGCHGLVSVTIPEGVTSIGNDAFKGCLELRSVTIPASVTSIGRDAFWGALESFEVDERNAVYCSINGLLCSKDRGTLICGVNGNVIIPSCVTNIAIGAFNGCSRLKSVTIPSSVKIIGGQALVGELGHKGEFRRLFELMREGWDGGPNLVFGYCSGLRSFVVDEANTAYSSRNGLLCSKDGRTLICGVNGDVTIPPGVTNIGRSAFYGYNGLKSVKIPASVMRIEERAFYASWLESLTIPSTVTNIDCRAFMSCPNLETIDVVRNGKIERESVSDFFRRFGFTEQQQSKADKADQRRLLQAAQEELDRVRAEKDASAARSPQSERP